MKKEKNYFLFTIFLELKKFKKKHNQQITLGLSSSKGTIQSKVQNKTKRNKDA